MAVLGPLQRCGGNPEACMTASALLLRPFLLRAGEGGLPSLSATVGTITIL